MVALFALFFLLEWFEGNYAAVTNKLMVDIVVTMPFGVFSFVSFVFAANSFFSFGCSSVLLFSFDEGSVTVPSSPSFLYVTGGSGAVILYS